MTTVVARSHLGRGRRRLPLPLRRRLGRALGRVSAALYLVEDECLEKTKLPVVRVGRQLRRGLRRGLRRSLRRGRRLRRWRKAGLGRRLARRRGRRHEAHDASGKNMRSDQVSELVMTRSQSQGQRGLPRVVAGPVVGPCTEQRFDCAEILIAHGKHERRVAVVVGVVDRLRHGGTNTGDEVRY